jgi:hypothetical protein
MCVQEEERLKSSHGDSVNFLKQNKKKSYHDKNAKPQGKFQWEKGSSSKLYGRAPQNDHHQRHNNEKVVDRDQCKWCEKKGHYQKDCSEFQKHLTKKGDDIIMFVDESVYLSYVKSSWWIDSGATIHVANSLQGFYTRRTLQRGERRLIVAKGVEAKAEAIGELLLELNNSFILHLHNVLYVPSFSLMLS